MRRIPLIAIVTVVSLGPLAGQGPTLTGAGYTNPTQIRVAPGQITTFFVSGLKTVLTQPLRAQSLPLPNSLGGISVTVSQLTNPSYPAPMLAVQQMPLCGAGGAPPPPTPSSPSADCLITAITVQIPYEIVPPQIGSDKGSNPAVSVVVTENGTASQHFTIASSADNFHVLNTCDAFPARTPSGSCIAIVTHLDGTLVTPISPAKAGETVVIYAFGLGSTNPTPKTGQASPTPAAVLSSVVYFQFDFQANATPSRPYFNPHIMAAILTPAPVFAGLTPGQVGLYQINMKLPDTFPAVPACDTTALALASSGSVDPLYVVQSNLTINMAGANSFDGAAICVQP